MTTQSDAPAAGWRSPFVLAAAGSLGLIAVFAYLALEVIARRTEAFDRAVRDWVFAHRSPLLVSICRIVTLLGDPLTLLIAAAILAFMLARAGARVRPLVVAALPLCLTGTATALRKWYEIPRPPRSAAALGEFGFPSGHTLGSTALAIVVGYVLVRERGARGLGWTIALVVPLAVGISRLYLDMHWASDVIGGWLIGGAYACAVCAVYRQALRRSRPNRP